MLASATPATHQILMIESAEKLRSKRWHVQRAHFMLASLRRFATELRSEGFEVDYRRAQSFGSGIRAHRKEFRAERVIAMEPTSRAGLGMLRANHVELTRSNQFLCHPDEFSAWATGRKSFKMEDFYRAQRRRFGYLMDDNQPVTGRWNYDEENRQPPPRRSDTQRWPRPIVTPLDEIDEAVLSDLDELGVQVWGARPSGLWATSRSEAVRRLRDFVEEALPVFGPHEDAMLSDNWHLAHSRLAQYMNIGLLHPREVCDQVESAFRSGVVPIASAEGFLRQVLGWREYVWGVYWLWGSEYGKRNELEATRALPAAFLGQATTKMRCVGQTLKDLYDHGWTHHIQRLMILSNFALIAGIDPQQMTQWMWAGFVDGAEWVMVPNVIGMGLHADGGSMATKPYAAGGAYIDRMSDYCKGCAYDRRKRVGEDACPFTTLYWDFLARHEDRFAKNHRMTRQVHAAKNLADLPAVRVQATEMLHRLGRGEL